MTHEALREKLLDLAYGELSPREAREVEGHAAACAECAAELARMRGTRAVMRKLPEEPAPDAGERILVAAAREASEARARPRRLPRWIWRGSAVAALAALPPEQREVFVLREYAGLRFSEIAEVTRTPENTVKSRMRYALEGLRTRLEALGVGPVDADAAPAGSAAR